MKFILNGKEEGEVASATLTEDTLSVILKGDLPPPDPTPDPEPEPDPEPTPEPEPTPVPPNVKLVYPIDFPGQGLVTLNIPEKTIFSSSFTIPKSGEGRAYFTVEDRSGVGIDLWISKTPGGKALEGNSGMYGRGLMADLGVTWGMKYGRLIVLEHGQTYYINCSSSTGAKALFYRVVT